MLQAREVARREVASLPSLGVLRKFKPDLPPFRFLQLANLQTAVEVLALQAVRLVVVS